MASNQTPVVYESAVALADQIEAAKNNYLEIIMKCADSDILRAAAKVLLSRAMRKDNLREKIHAISRDDAILNHLRTIQTDKGNK